MTAFRRLKAPQVHEPGAFVRFEEAPLAEGGMKPVLVPKRALTASPICVFVGIWEVGHEKICSAFYLHTLPACILRLFQDHRRYAMVG